MTRCGGGLVATVLHSIPETNRTNVWDYASVNSLKGSRREDLALHPTVKPTGLNLLTGFTGLLSLGTGGFMRNNFV